jgi:hypothetical protein
MPKGVEHFNERWAVVPPCTESLAALVRRLGVLTGESAVRCRGDRVAFGEARSNLQRLLCDALLPPGAVTAGSPFVPVLEHPLKMSRARFEAT